MPKKQPPTRNPLRLFFRFWKRKSKDEKFILIFFAILGTFILSNIIFHQVRVAYERAQYTRAIADLDTLYYEIAAEVGPADKVKESRYCRYSSMKYARGPRSCYIYKYFAYDNQARAGAIALSRQIIQVVRKSAVVDFEREKLPQSSFRDERDFTGAFFSVQGIKYCSLAFGYVDPDDIEDMYYTQYEEGKGLGVSLDCSGGDQAEYFPVIK